MSVAEPSEIELRAARPEDALAVARVHVRAWRVAYRDLIDPDFLAALRAEERARGYRLERGGAAETVVAVAGEAVVGFVAFGPGRDPDAKQAGEVYALYVDPGHWRAGAGSLLLAEACRRLRRRGFREGVLWVLLGNEPGERFYEAAGWRRDGAERTEQPYGVISRVRRFRRALG